MNDNDPFAYHEDAKPLDARSAQNEQIARSGPLAEKAIVHPEALTIDEIREMAWGLFVALRRLKDHERGAAWDVGLPSYPS